MLADFGFRARHITTSRWGIAMPDGFGSAGVPPAILNLRMPWKNCRQDAGATNSIAHPNSKSKSRAFDFEAGHFRERNILPC
jgi:hypothetical protein